MTDATPLAAPDPAPAAPAAQVPAAPVPETSQPSRAAQWSGKDPLEKRPWWAAIFSLVPGLGQVYVGYTQLGFVHALVVGACIMLMATLQSEPLIPLVSIFLLFFWLYNVVDAYRRAKLYNEARAGRLDIELPHGLPQASFRGSLIGGGALMALGLLLLTNTLFGVSLAWIEDWWPLALVAGGAYLFVMALRDRQREEGASEV